MGRVRKRTRPLDLDRNISRQSFVERFVSFFFYFGKFLWVDKIIFLVVDQVQLLFGGYLMSSRHGRHSHLTALFILTSWQHCPSVCVCVPLIRLIAAARLDILDWALERDGQDSRRKIENEWSFSCFLTTLKMLPPPPLPSSSSSLCQQRHRIRHTHNVQENRQTKTSHHFDCSFVYTSLACLAACRWLDFLILNKNKQVDFQTNTTNGRYR